MLSNQLLGFSRKSNINAGASIGLLNLPRLLRKNIFCLRLPETEFQLQIIEIVYQPLTLYKGKAVKGIEL